MSQLYDRRWSSLSLVKAQGRDDVDDDASGREKAESEGVGESKSVVT